MVTKYHRLMCQLNDSKEQLVLACSENSRLKSVTMCLERTVAELYDRDVDACSVKSSFDDDAISLIVSRTHVCLLQ